MLSINDEEKNNEILLKHKENEKLYQDFATCIESILSQAIDGIKIINISKRVKTNKSLSEKLIKKQSKYNDINEITDIIGVRIITLFTDDVDKVAEIVENEFELDMGNSIDKRKNGSPDKFGYMSLHYVVKMKPNRISLPEYKIFTDLKAEIQIRTSLQHSWAEMEHGLQYKKDTSLPYKIKRQLYGLSSLLEIADSQFVLLKNYEVEYIEESTTLLGNDKPERVIINEITLPLLFKDEKSVLFEVREKFLDTKGNRKFGKDDLKAADIKSNFNSSISFYIECLNAFNISNFKELESFFDEKFDNLLKYSDKIIRGIQDDIDMMNISNFFFMFMLTCFYKEMLDGSEVFENAPGNIKTLRDLTQ
ncbi:GTP pyrophosphokinase [Providencia rettgeri]|uniref:GTP pyrophosphokinase n=1 Tax=Providencia rettgeri TaxID=587 RepID=UPI001CFB05C6|nr:RelA/SpoT domain-containing protein [Providencia rettgeri]MCB4815151.1 RelA/SpoT domain-containing protein [Providencia rettgeri]MCJ2287698.1 RelA/SpoT domain-containing protein [Providencia rettgeri]